MKSLLISILLASFLHSDEMQRIESIVQDITKLRVEYEQCLKSLKSEETIQVDIVEYPDGEDEIVKYKKLLEQEREENKILKSKIAYMHNLLSKNEIKNSSKSSKIEKTCVQNSSKNSFPKLMPKEKLKQSAIERPKKFRASPFRLKNDAPIYNAQNGKKIDEWEKSRSFTSNKKTDSWVKITGYFVDKKWRGAKKEMWIESKDVFKR